MQEITLSLLFFCLLAEYLKMLKVDLDDQRTLI